MSATTLAATATILPKTEEAVASTIAAAAALGEPLAIEGNGSKRAMLRPVQAARTLSLRGLTGIDLYRPQELIIQAQAGTPVPVLEATLAEGGQQLIAEPPDFSAMFGGARPCTIGGLVATNLSGPRRIAWGATRDHVMGVRAVNGKGEVFRSGGRVLKNVTGLDLCKLLTGSHGTLGVLTQVTLKVLPAPEASGTLAIAVADLAQGVAALSAGLGSPYGVSGAALLPAGGQVGGQAFAGTTALLRIEDFAEFVRYRCGRLAEDLARFGAITLLEDAPSRAVWRAVRDAEPLGALPEDAVWRLSVKPSAAPALAEALRGGGITRLLLDWGGGLVWAAGSADAGTHLAVTRAVQSAGGSFTLFRAPDALRSSVAVIPEEPAPLAAITARVKATMDPRRVLNPGRMRAGC